MLSQPRRSPSRRRWSRSSRLYQEQVLVNARTMAQVFIERGYDVVSGGTDDHLFLVSFIQAGLTGKEVDAWLGAANITVNKNAVPNDPQSPSLPVAFVLARPAHDAWSCAGEARELAGWMCDVIDGRGDQVVIERIRGRVWSCASVTQFTAEMLPILLRPGHKGDRLPAFRGG